MSETPETFGEEITSQAPAPEVPQFSQGAREVSPTDRVPAAWVAPQGTQPTQPTQSTQSPQSPQSPQSTQGAQGMQGAQQSAPHEPKHWAASTQGSFHTAAAPAHFQASQQGQQQVQAQPQPQTPVQPQTPPAPAQPQLGAQQSALHSTPYSAPQNVQHSVQPNPQVNPHQSSQPNPQATPQYRLRRQGPGATVPQQPSAPTENAPAQKRGGPSWWALIIAMILTAALTLAGAWLLMQLRPANTASSSSAASNAPKQTEPVTSAGDSPDWQAVAAAVSPAVVTINVESAMSSDVGSGVVYSAEGDIVTNHHVISSAMGDQGTISVTLADSRIYEAEIVGTDKTTDLAVIRLKTVPSDLTVATFGSSAQLAVGQEIMAIGAPLGLSNTATTGIISALNRPVEVSSSNSGTEQTNPNDPFGQLPQLQNRSTTSSESVITNAIQVDASINPGNSGGPLFDAAGQVIGINSSIASNTSAYETAGSIGLGFAIPVDLVTSVADQLIATGTVDHAVLGVSVQSATAQIDGAELAGAQIVDVTAGGGAANAGLQKGDVVVAVNGETVSSSKQLTGYIRRYKGGDEVTITYVRDGQKYDVTAVLTSQPQR